MLESFLRVIQLLGFGAEQLGLYPRIGFGADARGLCYSSG
jgi:hypothetical protein